MSTLHKATLQTGLPMAVWPMAHVKTMTLLLAIRAGSRCETQQENGLAHFLEHMFFSGSTKYPTNYELSLAIEGAGGRTNAATQGELCSYLTKTRDTNAEVAFSVLSEMLLNHLFRPEDIERERKVILEELAAARDDEVDFLSEAFGLLFFGDTPLGRPTIGTKDTIAALQRDDLVAFRDRWYFAENSILVAAGGCDPPSIVSLAEKYFSNFVRLPKAQSHIESARISTTGGPFVKVLHRQREQTRIIIGFPSYQRTDPKNLAAELLSVVLGGGMVSRLFQEVRYKRGLAYQVSCSSSASHDHGGIVVYAGVKPENARAAVTTILEELIRTIHEPVSHLELECAKAFRSGILAESLERPASIATYIANDELLGTPRDPLAVIDECNTVTQEELQEAAAELFRPEKLYCAISGPNLPTTKEIKKWLKEPFS